MPNEQRKLDNLDCVYKAAYELFVENGIDDTTKVKLADKTGLSLSSLNRYFANKLDCVLGTAEWLSRNVREMHVFRNERFDGTHTGYEDLTSFFDIVKALFYESPKLFVFCAECRVYVYRNSNDFAHDCETIRQAFGTSWFVESILSRGIRDGSIRQTLNPKEEAMILRETYIGFLASIALSGNRDPNFSEALIDHFIRETLSRCAS